MPVFSSVFISGTSSSPHARKYGMGDSEKTAYRLPRCGKLSLGLLITWLLFEYSMINIAVKPLPEGPRYQKQLS